MHDDLKRIKMISIDLILLAGQTHTNHIKPSQILSKHMAHCPATSCAPGIRVWAPCCLRGGLQVGRMDHVIPTGIQRDVPKHGVWLGIHSHSVFYGIYYVFIWFQIILDHFKSYITRPNVLKNHFKYILTF